MEIVKKYIFFSFLSHATDLTEHWKTVRHLLHVHTNVYHTLGTLAECMAARAVTMTCKYCGTVFGCHSDSLNCIHKLHFLNV